MLFVRYPLIFQSFLNFSGVLFVFSYSVKLFFQKTLAFFSAWDYTFLRQSNKGFAPQNQIFDSSGQGAIPYRRYSPRADAFPKGGCMIRWNSEADSIVWMKEECAEKRILFRFRLFAVLKRVLCFRFFIFMTFRPEASAFGAIFSFHSLVKAA